MALHNVHVAGAPRPELSKADSSAVKSRGSKLSSTSYVNGEVILRHLIQLLVQYDNGIIVYNTMIIIIVCLFVTEVLAISMNKFYNG